jgi:hypothetical protein
MGIGLDFATVMRGLHKSKIRVGFQTFSGGISIWVSDQLYRIRAERVFDGANPITIENSVALWLHSTVLQVFPGSDYAIQHRPKTAPIPPAVVRPERADHTG